MSSAISLPVVNIFSMVLTKEKLTTMVPALAGDMIVRHVVNKRFFVYRFLPSASGQIFWQSARR